MKQQSNWLAVVTSVIGGLVLAQSAQAQNVTGTTYLSNLDPATFNTSPNATYANWNDSGVTTFTSLSTGLEISSGGYGSMYYVIPAGDVQTLNAADTIATLTITVNSPDVSSISWFGLPFILNDNSGAATFSVYSAPGNPGNPAGVTWNGNVVTETVNLTANEIAAIQAGTDAIYSFNLEADPASFSGPPVYDITFNSLVLSAAPVPEPGSFALAGVGAVCLFFFRRR